MLRLKNRFSKEEKKEYDRNNIFSIDDELVYGDEHEDDSNGNSSQNTHSRHSSTDSMDDDDLSVDDGEISRQEDEVEHIKYQIALKKKQKEIDRLNMVKERLGQHFTSTLSTATGTTN